MKYLNLCAGANRPQDPEWWNIDQLHDVLQPGTPERANLDSEERYLNVDVLKQPLPFADNEVDAILASHCVEHWDCQEAVRVMIECRRVLKPGGILLISVPDASYHRRVNDRDTVENAVELFGEPIHLPDGETTFLGYSLFNRWHKAVLTEDALWAYFVRAGFGSTHRLAPMDRQHPEIAAMLPVMNRRKFSLEMWALKNYNDS